MKTHIHFLSKPFGVLLLVLTILLLCFSMSRSSFAFDPQRRDEAADAHLEFFLDHVCLPHLEEGRSLSEVVLANKLHKERTCSIQGCTENLCSNQPEIGCAAVGENYCSIIVKDDLNFPILMTNVAGILGNKGRKWRVVPGDKTRAGFETTYCNGENTLNLRTFAVSPGHVPDAILRFVNRPEFDVTIQRNGSSWCN